MVHPPRPNLYKDYMGGSPDSCFGNHYFFVQQEKITAKRIAEAHTSAMKLFIG
jgi:hypothetical protein